MRRWAVNKCKHATVDSRTNATNATVGIQQNQTCECGLHKYCVCGRRLEQQSTYIEHSPQKPLGYVRGGCNCVARGGTRNGRHAQGGGTCFRHSVTAIVAARRRRGRSRRRRPRRSRRHGRRNRRRRGRNRCNRRRRWPLQASPLAARRSKQETKATQMLNVLNTLSRFPPRARAFFAILYTQRCNAPCI